MKRALAAALLCLACGSADAAIIYLRNGSTLTGTVVKSSGGQVVVETPEGEVYLSPDQIDHIDYGAAPETQPPAPESAPPPEYAPSPRRRHVRRIVAEEPSEFAQTFSILAGAAVPYGNLNLSAAGGGTQNNGDWGPLIGVQYMYQTGPHLGLGLEFDYAHRSVDDSFGAIPNLETDASGESVMFLGLIKERLVTSGWARPYLIVGGGAQQTSTYLDGTPVPGYAWTDTGTNETRRLIDDSAWGWAATARLGFDFLQAAPSVFGLELGWTHIAPHSYQATTQGEALGLTSARSTIDMLTVDAKWGFSFGEEAP